MQLPFPTHANHIVSIDAFGARGDGIRPDTAAINAAIVNANARGGGLVIIPAGRFLTFSIQLRSDVTIILSKGATLVAADPARFGHHYDAPEDNGPQLYQDFGHSHWCNSLIWGIGLQHIAIIGPGTIEGSGLTRNGPGSLWSPQAGERPLSMNSVTDAQLAQLEPDHAAMAGLGNKAIGLRDCQHIHLSGFTIDRAGHFAILGSGVRNLVIEDLTIDVERDGIDLDCVRDTQITRCRINTPNDDAIAIKSSLALGKRQSSQGITISDCAVSGFDCGSLIAGTFGRTQRFAPDRDRVTGRIKLGTESNGDMRNIKIENCRFTRSRGLSILSVDGGMIENIDVEGLQMDEVTSAPLFLRLGARLRGPEPIAPGAICNVRVKGLHATNVLPDYAIAVAGLATHPITDLDMEDIRIAYTGTTTSASATPPAELADAYPEASMFGPSPGWAFWARHAKRLNIRDFNASCSQQEARPAVWLDDALECNDDGSFERLGKA